MAQATYLRHGGQPYSLRLVLLRMGLAYALPVTSQAVVSYTAFSPLPHSGGSFLLRFPEGYPCRTLSGILPCEARTFLTWHEPAAIVCPAEIQNIVSDSICNCKCGCFVYNVLSHAELKNANAGLCKMAYNELVRQYILVGMPRLCRQQRAATAPWQR